MFALGHVKKIKQIKTKKDSKYKINHDFVTSALSMKIFHNLTLERKTF